MQAGQEVATTCAPLSRIAAGLRSRIFCDVAESLTRIELVACALLQS